MISPFITSVSSSLLFGLIFLGAGNRDDAMDNNFNSHFGAITFVLISAMFGPAQSVMLAFPFERPMFMREFATGTCTIIALYYYNDDCAVLAMSCPVPPCCASLKFYRIFELF